MGTYEMSTKVVLMAIPVCEPHRAKTMALQYVCTKRTEGIQVTIRFQLFVKVNI